MTPTMAEFQNVSRMYGGGSAAVVAVHGATGFVPARARIALVGPSGSGKSTLLHLLAGLERPTTGTVTWPGLAGAPRTGLAIAGVAVVFQGPSLVPTLNVLENVLAPLQLAGEQALDAEVRARAALEVIGVLDLADRLPDFLSGGQAQRVAIARALAMEPRLILADEPTGQLDSVTGTHVIDVLIEAADRVGAALVVTTHDHRVADRLQDRWVMREGRLHMDGVSRMDGVA